jgi:hypothetical protein
MRLRDMKYIGFKHQRENKQNSDKNNDNVYINYIVNKIWISNVTINNDNVHMNYIVNRTWIYNMML